MEYRHARAAAIHAIGYLPMQMDVEIGGGPEALDERDRTAVSLGAFESRLLDQKGGNDAVNALQHWREQIGMGGEEDTQRNWKREHPLPHWHPWDDIVDQVRSALCHTPCPAGGAKPAPLAGEGQQLLVAALTTAQPQKAVGEDAAFEKGIEHVFDKVG